MLILGNVHQQAGEERTVPKTGRQSGPFTKANSRTVDMKMIDDQPFALLSILVKGCAIQAGEKEGAGLTLQPFDGRFRTPSQLFVLRARPNGLALVSLGSHSGETHNCVLGRGADQPLIMRPYRQAADVQDGWRWNYGMNQAWPPAALEIADRPSQGLPCLRWSAGMRGSKGSSIVLSKGQYHSFWQVELVH